MFTIYIDSTFGVISVYDKIFNTYDEAESFLKSIGEEYTEWDDELTGDLCIGYYDEFWDIMYLIHGESWSMDSFFFDIRD